MDTDSKTQEKSLREAFVEMYRKKNLFKRVKYVYVIQNLMLLKIVFN